MISVGSANIELSLVNFTLCHTIWIHYILSQADHLL